MPISIQLYSGCLCLKKFSANPFSKSHALRKVVHHFLQDNFLKIAGSKELSTSMQLGADANRL